MTSSSVFSSAIAGVALTVVCFVGLPGMRNAAVAATPPPTPPPIGAPATPAPNASLVPAPNITPATMPSMLPGVPTARPSGTPSPPPATRKGIEGVWEVAIQRPTTTDYTHFAVKQQGDALNGTYLDAHGKKYPLVGSVEGQDVRLIVTMPNGTTLLLEGRLDGTTDMIGMLTMPDAQVPFTASYRAKEKWIENVNPSPGGMGGSQGGYTPP